jgi:outer membrane protein, heavy metal efflux system
MAGLPSDRLEQQGAAGDGFAMTIGVGQADEQIPPVEHQCDAAGHQAAALGRAYQTLVGAGREIELLRNSIVPNARKAVEGTESGYSQGRFTLLELLDVQSTATDAALREIEVLVSFHKSVATIESLTGTPLALTREGAR